MELPEDPLDGVIREIASLLAAGYLRLCKERTLGESAATSVFQEATKPRDNAAGALHYPPRARTLNPREKGG